MKISSPKEKLWSPKEENARNEVSVSVPLPRCCFGTSRSHLEQKTEGFVSHLGPQGLVL